MTPVDELRKAARLMRERAEAAQHGPWESTGWIVKDNDGTDYARVWRTDADRHEDMPVGTAREEDAEHIASWSPVVALALADLLDREADTAARFYDGRVGKYDLAVARAYLGQSMCHSGHPFVPGIAEDAPDTPDDRWCNTCGEARRAQPVMPARNEATR